MECLPLTSDRWHDFEALFGERGACGGCWCMWWRQTGKEYDQNKGQANRQAIFDLVHSGSVPGLIGYSENDKPVGWIAVEPRQNYSRLSRSRILKPVDSEEVWSVTCFFIDKEYRHQKLTIDLLDAAKSFVRDNGGKVLEGYPIDPRKEMAPAFIYTGIQSAFEQSGFAEVARRSETRPIMRYYVGN